MLVVPGLGEGGGIVLGRCRGGAEGGVMNELRWIFRPTSML